MVVASPHEPDNYAVTMQASMRITTMPSVVNSTLAAEVADETSSPRLTAGSIDNRTSGRVPTPCPLYVSRRVPCERQRGAEAGDTADHGTIDA